MELEAAGISATGELLRATGTHADVAARILARSEELHAATIVLGAERRHRRASQVVGEIAARAAGHVVILQPEAGPLGQPATHRSSGGHIP